MDINRWNCDCSRCTKEGEVIAMAKDWASECVDRWFDIVYADPNRVLGAIQETIARAAMAAMERAHDLGIPADKQHSIGQAIRGLGAPK